VLTGIYQIILDSQELFSFGENSFGELGIGNKMNQSTPQKLLFEGKKASKIVAGDQLSFILQSIFPE